VITATASLAIAVVGFGSRTPLIPTFCSLQQGRSAGTHHPGGSHAPSRPTRRTTMTAGRFVRCGVFLPRGIRVSLSSMQKYCAPSCKHRPRIIGMGTLPMSRALFAPGFERACPCAPDCAAAIRKPSHLGKRRPAAERATSVTQSRPSAKPRRPDESFSKCQMLTR